MIGRLLFPLCLCCVVLCAFIGFLSKRAIKEAEQISTEFVELDCRSLIEKPPRTSSGILIQDFVFVDRVATIDSDGDEKWDEVAIPLFSRDGFKSKIGYSSVIACFRDVPDLEALHQRLADNQLQVNYRANDQDLDSSLHSQLAKKFKQMDFKNSPVVTVGYGENNPVLGEKSLKISYRLGVAAIVVGLLSLAHMGMSTLFSNMKLPKREPRRRVVKKKRPKKPSKRSGPTNYDVEPTGGVLDRVRSMRDQEPSR